MIDLYTWQTPNGRKVSIMLEEIGIDYKVFPINIAKDEQFQPHFLEISPNNRIPAIIDKNNNNYSLFESGAILMYLAEKSGQLINKSNSDEYFRTIEWLMWQKAGFGPMLGQAHHFLHYNKGKAPYAEERYRAEAKRLYSVLEKHLSKSPFIAEEYSIADIAIWPWVSRYEWQEINLSEFPNIRSWYKKILAREPVQKGYNIPAQLSDIPVG